MRITQYHGTDVLQFQPNSTDLGTGQLGTAQCQPANCFHQRVGETRDPPRDIRTPG
jgi:hypothetical protein